MAAGLYNSTDDPPNTLMFVRAGGKAVQKNSHSFPNTVLNDFLSGTTAIGKERSKTAVIDQQPSLHRSTRTALRERKHVINKLFSR